VYLSKPYLKRVGGEGARFLEGFKAICGECFWGWIRWQGKTEAKGTERGNGKAKGSGGDTKTSEPVERGRGQNVGGGLKGKMESMAHMGKKELGCDAEFFAAVRIHHKSKKHTEGEGGKGRKKARCKKKETMSSARGGTPAGVCGKTTPYATTQTALSWGRGPCRISKGRETLPFWWTEEVNLQGKTRRKKKKKNQTRQLQEALNSTNVRRINNKVKFGCLNHWQKMGKKK